MLHGSAFLLVAFSVCTAVATFALVLIGLSVLKLLDTETEQCAIHKLASSNFVTS